METTISTLSILPSGKAEVTRFKESFKNEILANTQNALPVLVRLKYAEKTIKEILADKEIDDHFLTEALRYDKDDKIDILGANIRVQETGVGYDYKASGDPQWIELDEQIKKLTEQRKERKKFLVTIPYDQGTVDPSTGLFITRPPKTSTTKCVVTLK